ncbi:hypothetical protein HGRIS_007194 [Hohenbuehelia grisea]|uniref:Uncharacterized protein n=1 Tax=Hohenbuehelia grisea TaxID=104357 RepID=A0ABR3JBX8_9AGAR
MGLVTQETLRKNAARTVRDPQINVRVDIDVADPVEPSWREDRSGCVVSTSQ